MYIEIHNAKKTIKNKVILNNINLNLEKGNVYGLIGHNGSGKTMLLRAISGLITLDSGYIKIDNTLVELNKPLPVKVGIIIENVKFYDDLTGFENLKFLSSINNEISDDVINTYLKKFDLLKENNKKVKEYSLGMMQKLAIIQAIMEDQSLILLDEPTNGLDRNSVEIFNEQIKELKDKGKTIILVSHNDSEIKELCDEIIEISDGVITKR
ncbi:MAG: ATP-binding cassette domain-containing protein [Anaerococcus sp.]|jgi:ABC transporter|uniref:ABC transporter ATP-binding protein n=1 Tax=Anaerococcus sp. TaxID=1872515 RepID=UPI00290F0627|nr:ATP-binding cassette domain-containing protein [Anaerococcus sp.]MDU7411103.1 ATP-binding cassette domain-containing protein [Anaerococcus sp.]